MTTNLRIKTGFLTLSAVACLMGMSASPAFSETMDPAARKCVTREEVNLTVNVSNQLMEVGEAVKFLDKTIEEVEAIGKEVAVKGLEVRSKNFNINSNTNYNRYQMQGQQASPTAVNLNGSVNFTLASDENAGAFIEALQTKGFNINFRMSSNSQCR